MLIVSRRDMLKRSESALDSNLKLLKEEILRQSTAGVHAFSAEELEMFNNLCDKGMHPREALKKVKNTKVRFGSLSDSDSDSDSGSGSGSGSGSAQARRKPRKKVR